MQVADNLKCRVLAEGANGPTADADLVLEKAPGRDILIPDILCNSRRRRGQLSSNGCTQDLQQLFWEEGK